MAAASAVSHNDTEFLAADEEVEIVPNFRLDRLQLVSGAWGPFFPQIPVKVPVWLALQLKKQRKCEIRLPKWLECDSLRALIQAEKATAEVFGEVPFFYQEIAHQILLEASAPAVEIEDARLLLKDLEEIRAHKIRDSLRSLTARPVAGIRLNNICAFELNEMRAFFTFVLDRMHSLASEGTEPPAGPTASATPPAAAAATAAAPRRPLPTWSGSGRAPAAVSSFGPGHASAMGAGAGGGGAASTGGGIGAGLDLNIGPGLPLAAAAAAAASHPPPPRRALRRDDTL